MISNMFFSEDIDSSLNDNTVVVINPMNQIVVPFIPTMYSFILIAMVTDLDDIGITLYGKHTLGIELRHEETQELAFEFKNEEIENTDSNAINFNLQFQMKNITFKKTGIYIGKIFLDEKLIAEAKLKVLQK